jgi:energy-converting hydrogenase Eha subunit E
VAAAAAASSVARAPSVRRLNAQRAAVSVSLSLSPYNKAVAITCFENAMEQLFFPDSVKLIYSRL